MAVDVKRYVQGCKECAMSKSPRHLPAGKLLPLPVPSHPWSHLGIDFIVDLPVSEGCTCVLVIIDRFSKSCQLVPLPGQPTALETAEYLFNHVFSHQESLSQFLGWAEYAQNSLRQSTTGLTPFQCVLGYQPPLFPWDGEPSDVPAVDYWFRESERVWGLTEAQNNSRPSTIPSPYIPTGTKEPPLPLLVDNGTAYLVKEILDSWRRGGRLEYLVNWEGYGPKEQSWVPRNDIFGPSLLEDFHTSHPDRPAPWGRGRPPRRWGPRSSGADHGGGEISTFPSLRSSTPSHGYRPVLLFTPRPRGGLRYVSDPDQCSHFHKGMFGYEMASFYKAPANLPRSSWAQVLSV
ncbi:hypothetical protein QTP70_004530 [Hemibagrus guttatus]|uniref:Chromo domain-containing protein n=1 Tax=Hemibagrus guttatus TaxID=175788 RepID=A0AAE0UMK7_9TELE|nr:hypothetical protein QTP70_004530 [Hemibagrus guttatus]